MSEQPTTYAPRELPTGTVTFLFTDIQGSTDLAQKYPDALQAMLMRHHAILRGAIESHRGVVFRLAGDSFSAAFHTPNDALNAALDAQRQLFAADWQPAPIRVRMGINTGAARAKGLDSLDGEYEGYSTLARVARVMALAHGGQILLSNATSELVRDNLPPNISVRDMGEHKLKGFISAEHLWQVVAPDLPQDFPPLYTGLDVPSNLPVAPGHLVGRTQELEQVKTRLAQTRLLTLLGPGGTGKTRLALQVASDLRAEFQDRVYFVDLAASRDSETAVAALARTLGIRESTDKPLLDELKQQIKNKKLLSLLDNFEQVTIAAPAMAELLRDCPELKMLVTSREALHVRGENVYPVPPLSLPQSERSRSSLEQIAQCEAVQLFIERAQAAKPDFQLTRENAYAVAEICLRLDGLPLAIELATARLNVFSPQALAERLNNRLKILRGGARDLPARQQTLRDTIDWSYEMLRADEQQLFALLSVFSGATLEAVESVANQIERFADADVMEAIGSLADKSLIRQIEPRAGAPRVQMLETIREFAAAQLDKEAELRADAQHAHAQYFADFAQSEWKNLTGEARDAALHRLTDELENLKTAWNYWTAQGDFEQLRKITDSLWYLYDARGWSHASIELISRLLHLLEATASTPERLREEILLQTSLARAIQSVKGYTQEVEQAYQRALELCDRAGQVPELLPVLRGLATFHTMRTEHAKALALGNRIVELAERLGDRDMTIEGQMVVGYSLASLDQLQTGNEHLEKAIALYDPARQRPRRLGVGANEGVIALNASGMYSWMLGYPERAQQRLSQAVALARKLDHPFSRCYALFHYSLLHLWLGFPNISNENSRALLELAAEHDFQIWSAVGTCERGMALTMLGSMEQGVQMIEQGIQVYRGLKTPPIFYPMLLTMQASAYGIARRPQEGLPLVQEAVKLGAQSEGKAFAPELMGAVAELLVALNNDAEAEQLLQGAIQISQELQMDMIELRAAMKLARLWQAQHKTQQAHTLLSGSMEKMKEGFDMPDLVAARALLQELAG